MPLYKKKYLIYFDVTAKFRSVAMFVIFDVEIILYNILCVLIEGDWPYTAYIKYICIPTSALNINNTL